VPHSSHCPTPLMRVLMGVCRSGFLCLGDWKEMRGETLG